MHTRRVLTIDGWGWLEGYTVFDGILFFIIDGKAYKKEELL